MRDSVLNIFESQLGLNWRNKKFILAVSGGGDSMSLLYLMHSLDCNIIVAHVNYGLRGNDSDLDQECVSSFCTDQDISMELFSPNTQAYCDSQKVGIQEGARKLRYNWFESLLQKHQADYVVTAHHLQDVIETFIINLQRGTSSQGLHPIEVLKHNKLRPLARTEKDEIIQYLKVKQIAYREDASNQSNAYLRNKIRNSILPSLFDGLPKLKSGIISTMRNLSLDSDYLLTQLEKETQHALTSSDSGGVIQGYESLHKRLVYHILQKFGFNFDQLEQILSSKTSGKIFLSSSHRLIINRSDLIISLNNSKAEEQELNIDDFGTYHFGDLQIKVSKSSSPKWSNSKIAFFSAEQLTFPFVVKPWKAGDSFIPFGMSGRKKISDYLIDSKVSLNDKANTLVLEHENTIAWLIGMRTSELYKSNSEIENWVKIEVL